MPLCEIKLWRLIYHFIYKESNLSYPWVIVSIVKETQRDICTCLKIQILFKISAENNTSVKHVFLNMWNIQLNQSFNKWSDSLFRLCLIRKSFLTFSCPPSSSLGLTPWIRWDSCVIKTFDENWTTRLKNKIKLYFVLPHLWMCCWQQILSVSCFPDCICLLIHVLEPIHQESGLYCDLCFSGHHDQLLVHRVSVLLIHTDQYHTTLECVSQLHRWFSMYLMFYSVYVYV